jgi:hypothetical protein
MNRAEFFKHLRKRGSAAFGTSLSQGQVQGCESILDACRGYPLPHAAHVLAEVYHETGGGMLPVKETVFPYSRDKNPSDERVIARLDRAWAKGDLPWVSKPYWRDGMFGRGQIQLTHEYNYVKASAIVGADLVNNPDLALDLQISSRISAEGCRVGLFRGKALSDYDRVDGYDHRNARDIVNGDKRKNGPLIARYADAFEGALYAAGWGSEPPVRPDVEPIVHDDPQAPPVKHPAARVVLLVAAIISAIATLWAQFFGG